ncbi:MAG: helix-turn-helix transcriptional regulator [Acidimicrobiales bacterium]
MPPSRTEKLRALVGDPFRSGFNLTPRQAEIAKLAAFGFTLEEIGPKVGMEPSSVGSTLQAVKRKTGLGKAELTRSFVARLEAIVFDE